MELFSVKERTVFITGASRGIGKALALGFKNAGAFVIGTGRSDKSISWMNNVGIRGVVLDVCDKDQVQIVLKDSAQETGRLDCLINNAGLTAQTPMSLIKDDEVDELISTNLKGLIHTSQVFYELQKNKGGSIINIASIFAHSVVPATGTYCASKGAVLQITRSMAVEWARKKIRVNAICPGFFEAGMASDRMKRPSTETRLKSAIPMGRLGNSDELTGAAIFLASSASSYLTGQSIIIDGGVLSQIKV
ncbi:SDR family oxidoreductase [bacterium]|nr:SDR family oxidoreductase [bacterium]